MNLFAPLSLRKKYLLISVILFILFHLLTVVKGFNWDMYCWTDWGQFMHEHGLGSMYRGKTDYMPLFHYFLKIYVATQPSQYEVGQNIEYFKMVPLFVHFIEGYFVLLLIQYQRNESRPLLGTMVYLLNFGIIYNAIVWGQMDIILSCFVLISFYFAVKERITLSLIFYVAAINFKLQAIVFMPPLAILLFPLVMRDFKWTRFLQWFIAPVLVQVLILLPYYLDGSLDGLWRVVVGSFEKFPSISMKAYNLWFLFFPDLTNEVPDTITFMNITYKTWGLLLFCTLSFFAFIPFFKHIYRCLVERHYVAIAIDKALLLFALVLLLFFYFNTEMHERYSHPAIVFILIYGVRTRRPILPILATLAYFFNLEKAFYGLKLASHPVFVFNPVFISLIWLTVIVGLFLNVYDKSPDLSVNRLKNMFRMARS